MTTFARAEAFAPATVANLGVGFDVLGLALREPGDVVQVTRRPERGAVIVAIEGDGGQLPREPDKNTACVAAQAVLDEIGVNAGVEITLFKNLPLASGMGSSAASAVAAAVAVNALFGEPLSREGLLPACLEGEAVASGYHADNVGPSLFGGITMFSGISAVTMRRLPVPDDLHLAVVTPDVAVYTSDARAVLPELVPFKDMIAQTAALGRLVDALYCGDLRAAAAAMEDDRVIEPARQHLMPKLTEVRAVAKAVGAYGVFIGGAGPTLCAVCDSPALASAVSSAMKGVYDEAGMDSVARSTQVALEGASVLSMV